MNKYYMIPNSKDLGKFSEELILPLKDYSIGFDIYFTSREIEEISKNRTVNVIINKFLHKNELINIKNEINKMKSVKFFLIEDLGLTNIIEKTRIILNQSHIINNYKSVNYFNNLKIENIVISNELTIEELKTIREKTTSNLFLYSISRNMLMYSKRKLISTFYEYKQAKEKSLSKEIEENVSKKHLIIKEEKDGTCIFDKNIFSINPFISDLDNYNFIINFSNLTEEETSIILAHYKSIDLDNYINVDNYFSRNKIGYKVGDIK